MTIELLETFVRRSANRLGIDIHRHRPEASLAGGVCRMLEARGVDLVFDVGANVGQYASELRRSGYAGRIVSFEPVAASWAALSQAAAKDPRWMVPPRVAIGDRDGSVRIHVSENSISSSVLPMLDRHRDAAPASVYVADEMVDLARLDRLAGPFLGESRATFLKIDTQGYEQQVLAGAAELLRRPSTAGVQLEMSLVPLYEGQALFEPLVQALKAQGFELWGIWPGFIEPASGRMLQVDVVMMRSDAVAGGGS